MKLFLAASLSTLLLSACSSISVKDLHAGAGKVGKPKQVYVAPFRTDAAAFKIAGQKTDAEIAAYKQTTAAILADYTVKSVTAYVAPATQIAAANAAPAKGWLITGKFTRVNTGSRGLRVGVGLGAGGTKMETEVEVYDLASSRSQPFLRFATTGGSNAMPGLLSSTGPGSAVFSMASQAATGVTDDAARTSRMIAGALSEYEGAQGWIPPEKVYKVKKLGEYQLVHSR